MTGRGRWGHCVLMLFACLGMLRCESSEGVDDSRAGEDTARPTPPALESPPPIQTPSDQAVGNDPIANLRMGRGFNKLTESMAGDCVTFDGPAVDGDNSGNNTTFSLELIDNSITLFSKLEVSAAADIKFILGAGGDFEAKFANTASMTATSVYLLAKVTVKQAYKNIWNVRLTSDASTTFSNDPARFREWCGDGYVSSVTYGGRFYAVIAIHTTSFEDKNALTTSIQANGTGTWSMVADFERVLNSNVKNRRVSIHFEQIGGVPPDTAGCTTVLCITDRATKFTEIVRSAPVLLDYSYMPYTSVFLPPGPPPIDIANQMEVLAEIVKEKRERSNTRDMLQFALKFPKQHEPFDPTRVQASISMLNKDLGVLRKAASKCFNDYQACSVPEMSTLLISVPSWKGEQIAAASRSWSIVVDHSSSSSKCLDLLGSNPNNRAPIAQWDCNNGPNQRFYVIPHREGSYVIASSSSGKCFDIPLASDADGAPLEQYACHGLKHQQFDVLPIGDGKYRMVARHSGKCLEVSKGSAEAGASIVQATCNENPQQKFRFN